MQRETFIVLLLSACSVSMGRSNQSSVLSRLPRSRSQLHQSYICVPGEERSVSCSCPSGWVFYGQSCYLFADTSPVPFAEAEAYCQRRGGNLVRISTWSENSFLKTFLRRLTGPNSWIGLNDRMVEGVWEWTKQRSSPSFTDWCPGEPNNGRSGQDCAYFRFHNRCNGRWDDIDCDHHHLHLCEISL